MGGLWNEIQTQRKKFRVDFRKYQLWIPSLRVSHLGQMQSFKETFLVKWLKLWRRPRRNVFVGIPWVRWKKLFVGGIPAQMVLADEVETKATGGGLAQMEGSFVQETRGCGDVNTQPATTGRTHVMSCPGTCCALQRSIAEKAECCWAVIWWKCDPWKMLTSQRGRKHTARMTWNYQWLPDAGTNTNSSCIKSGNSDSFSIKPMETQWSMLCDQFFYCYHSGSHLHVRAPMGLRGTWQIKWALEQCWSPPLKAGRKRYGSREFSRLQVFLE